MLIRSDRSSTCLLIATRDMIPVCIQHTNDHEYVKLHDQESVDTTQLPAFFRCSTEDLVQQDLRAGYIKLHGPRMKLARREEIQRIE